MGDLDLKPKRMYFIIDFVRLLLVVDLVAVLSPEVLRRPLRLAAEEQRLQRLRRPRRRRKRRRRAMMIWDSRSSIRETIFFFFFFCGLFLGT